ncbi:MAG TPA: FAD-binding oxidoreductase [Streptosporangiaceae bacterium]|jgi:glycine/D-amino acid oxidase-like deaminating enzyme
MTLPASADAVIIGAGLVGAATAARLAATGRRVCVIDRSGPLGGTTAAGEGNILLSDKAPGPELSLALRSLVLWRQFAGERGAEFEFEPKGGVVVARSPGQLDALREMAARQRAAGVEVTLLDPSGLHDAEPSLARQLAGGARYPQDCQVQPMAAAMAYLAAGGRLTVTRAEATGLDHDGPVMRLVTDRGRIAAPVVVNCTGPWGGQVAGRLGSALPVRPRRGHILVTEPLPPLIRHKVYEADYVATVASDEEGTAYSAVVEGTASSTVLIGSSRDFSPAGRPEARVLAELARRAVALFPFLSRARIIRAYTGFRPACADHLPVIGPDALVPGLYHATGHEGAGIGLAPATAELITALIDGTDPAVDPVPFAPARFAADPDGGRRGR